MRNIMNIEAMHVHPYWLRSNKKKQLHSTLEVISDNK